MNISTNFFYTKTGRLIEFPNFSKNYYKFLMLKSIAFLIDYAVIIFFELLIQILTGLQWYIIGIAGIVWTLLYYAIMLMSFERTLGLILTKTYIIHSSGFILTKVQIFSRSLLSSFYALPIVGWALIITNVICTPFWKGVTLLDFLTATSLISKKLKNKLNEIELEGINIKVTKGELW